MVNTVYKAISKIMVSRMQPYLHQIFGLFQNAFTSGKFIHDDLLIVQEVLHIFYISKNKHGWCTIKLDTEKTYDRIGFSEYWINLIMSRVTTASYSLGHLNPIM